MLHYWLGLMELVYGLLKILGVLVGVRMGILELI